MSKNTTIVMVRHAEEPEEGGANLSVAGQARAHAYTAYLPSLINGDPSPRNRHLFAAADSSKSHRSRLTLTPLADAVGQPIHADVGDDDYAQLAKRLLSDPRYDEAQILICWHHGKILDLAHALGVRRHQLPKRAHWPTKWPDHIYGWTLVIGFDAAGSIDPDQTRCFNQKLMHGDHGSEPPHG